MHWVAAAQSCTWPLPLQLTNTEALTGHHHAFLPGGMSVPTAEGLWGLDTESPTRFRDSNLREISIRQLLDSGSYGVSPDGSADVFPSTQ